eukprot:maker-scaffold_29-snap-gene-2.6-mRNA-1 protein AED:0.39 eAED:0.39 QI:82/1/1/1/1/1/2/143/109
MSYTARSLQATPPEKGSFPLDHHKVCKPEMSSLLSCLKENKNIHNKCQELSKQYLQCRISNNLMQEEKLDDFFSTEEFNFAKPDQHIAELKKKGFLGGITAVKPKSQDT